MVRIRYGSKLRIGIGPILVKIPDKYNYNLSDPIHNAPLGATCRKTGHYHLSSAPEKKKKLYIISKIIHLHPRHAQTN